MKLWKTIKNWRLTEMDKSIYLPLESSHLQLDLELDLQKLKRKSPLRYFAHAIFHCLNPVQMIFEGPAASVLFIFYFSISHLRYMSHMRYCKCEIMTSKVGEVLKKKY